MNGTQTRDLTAILADLANFTVASSGARAVVLYHELEDAVRAQLAPLPEGEADAMAAEAERAARTMAPPVPGVTSHNGYTVRAVIYDHAHADGYLEACGKSTGVHVRRPDLVDDTESVFGAFDSNRSG